MQKGHLHKAERSAGMSNAAKCLPATLWGFHYWNCTTLREKPDVLKFWHQFTIKAAHGVTSQKPEKAKSSPSPHSDTHLPSPLPSLPLFKKSTFCPFQQGACRSSLAGLQDFPCSGHPMEPYLTTISSHYVIQYCLQHSVTGDKYLVDQHLLELGVDIFNDACHLLVLGDTTHELWRSDKVVACNNIKDS